MVGMFNRRSENAENQGNNEKDTTKCIKCQGTICIISLCVNKETYDKEYNGKDEG
jgi:hypothetical protein